MTFQLVRMQFFSLGYKIEVVMSCHHGVSMSLCVRMQLFSLVVFCSLIAMLSQIILDMYHRGFFKCLTCLVVFILSSAE